MVGKGWQRQCYGFGRRELSRSLSVLVINTGGQYTGKRGPASRGTSRGYIRLFCFLFIGVLMGK